MKTKFVLLFLGVLFLSGNVIAQVNDRVILQNESATGEIVGYTTTKYLFKIDGEERRVPREKVKNIQYGDTTKNMASMVKAYNKGQYNEVVSYGESVRDEIKDGPLREIHKPRVSYLMASSYFHQGAVNQAREEVKRALQQDPNQIWFDRMARIRLLALAFSKYDPDEEVSDDAYDQVSTVGETLISLCENKTEAPQSMVEELQVLKVEALEELGGKDKLGVTKVKYENLDVSDPALQNRVFAGTQRCVIRQDSGEQLKKLKEVQRAFKNKAEEDESPLIQAGLRNANGILSFYRWKNDGGETLLRDALFSFLNAQLIDHKPTDMVYPIQHRQSLLNVIRVYDAIDGISDNASSSDQNTSSYKEQAEQSLEELKYRYPGAPEVKKGKRILQK